MRATWALAVLLCDCAGGRGAVREAFECRDRRMGYAATGVLVYAEQGIRMTCNGDVPRIERYFTRKDGTETTQREIVGAATFQKVWEEFDGSGWRHLEDCDNPTAGTLDPVYTFEISNGERTRTFLCPGRELPFPYEQLRNALDMAAAELPIQDLPE